MYSGSSQTDLQFGDLVEVVLFGREVEGHAGGPVSFFCTSNLATPYGEKETAFTATLGMS